MNSRKLIATLVYCGWVLLLALGIYAPRGVAGQVVSGVYKVTETTHLGREVRVTLQIRLMNSGEDRIFVTQPRLRGFPHSGRSESKPGGVILGPPGRSALAQ